MQHRRDIALREKPIKKSNPNIRSHGFKAVLVFTKYKKWGYKRANPLDENEDLGILLFYDVIDDIMALAGYEALTQHIINGGGCGGNIANIRVINDMAYLFWDFDDVNEFSLKKDLLLDLLSSWRTLALQGAIEIIVRREGEHFEIDGVFEH